MWRLASRKLRRRHPSWPGETAGDPLWLESTPTSRPDTRSTGEELSEDEAATEAEAGESELGSDDPEVGGGTGDA